MQEIDYEDLTQQELSELMLQRLQEISSNARKKFRKTSDQMDYILENLNKEFGSNFDFKLQEKE